VFAAGAEIPLRTAHTIKNPPGQNASLLMMPAWQPGRYIVVKIVNIFPENAARDLPAVAASVLVFDGATGAMRAILDGGEVTARRTAAASALAARYLARPDARTLLVVGTGRIARNLVAAHCAARPFKKVLVWSRSEGKAQEFVASFGRAAPPIEATDDLQQAAGEADVISCATLALEPLVRGAWLREGTHLDLVGGYTPDMREVDDEAVSRSALIAVDTYEGALAEAGDLVQPLRSGLIPRTRIQAELAELCAGSKPGRSDPAQITLFKSVGTAIEDYAAATLVIENVG
jgi:alanine dehydrogenase